MATIIPGQGKGWGWLLAAGLAALALGLLALVWPVPATFFAIMVAAAMFVATGIFALIGGLRGQGHGRRGFLVVYGLLAVAAGLLIGFFPLSGALALTTLVAAWLLVRGLLEIAGGFGGGARWPWIVLGVINVVLAAIVWTGLPVAVLVLPGVFLGVSFMMSGAAETAAALAWRHGVRSASPAL